jgi:drug/metabolite transporter (DMT)-like permease
VFSAAFGYVLMGDRLSAAGLAGCALILVSMLGVQMLPMLATLKRVRG